MAGRRAFGFPVLCRMPPLLVPLIPFQVIRFHGRSAVHGRIAAGAAVTYRQKNRQSVIAALVVWRSLHRVTLFASSCRTRVGVVSANTTHVHVTKARTIETIVFGQRVLYACTNSKWKWRAKTRLSTTVVGVFINNNNNNIISLRVLKICLREKNVVYY